MENNMEKLLVTKVFKSDKDKEGRLLKDKNGKQFWKVGVKFDKYGDVWYSMLVFREDDEAMSLEAGDERSFVLSENKGFKNFKLPSRLDILEADVAWLKQVVTAKKVQAENPVDAIDYPPNTLAGEPFPDDIKPEDIPY